MTMRDANSIDPTSTPLTPEDARRLAEKREFEEWNAKRQKRMRLEQQATDKAKGTPEAKSFEDMCVKAVESAIDAYASGQSSFELEHDFRMTKVPRKVLGITVDVKEIEDIEKLWKYFRVRVLVNGNLDETTLSWSGSDGEPLKHPYHDGYVVVMDINAPWLEEALIRLIEGSGYQRTTYVSSFRGINQVMAYKLAYALPTSRLDDPQSN